MTSTLQISDLPLTHGVLRQLTLHRPDRRNALDTELLSSLLSEFDQADDDQNVRAVCLAASGPVFCAGGDVKEFRNVPQPRLRMAERASLMVALLRRIPELSVPVIAIGSGAALGAGAALVLACDVVLGVEDLVLGFPEVSSAVVPSVMLGAVVRDIPSRIAFDLFSTGRHIGATEALTNGLINSVVASRVEASARAEDFAERWAAIDRETLRQTKHLFTRMRTMTRDEALLAGYTVTAETWNPPAG